MYSNEYSDDRFDFDKEKLVSVITWKISQPKRIQLVAGRVTHFCTQHEQWNENNRTRNNIVYLLRIARDSRKLVDFLFNVEDGFLTNKSNATKRF